MGTEATRASIIELLFKRGFLIKHGRNIHSTEAGRILIFALPETATLPDMTAHWEMQLTDISKKQASYQQFMHELVTQLPSLLHTERDKLQDLCKITPPVRYQYAKTNNKQSNFNKKNAKC